MCYDIQKLGERINRIAERRFGLEADSWDTDILDYFHVSGFSHPKLQIIFSENDQIRSGLFYWGFIPSFCKSKMDAMHIWNQTLNARNDTIFTKPSYRQSIVSKRCLIPATGFYENRTVNKKKYPYFIFQKDNLPFCFGGIWDRWFHKETGEVFETFSIITVEANTLLEKIHNEASRMPFIVQESNYDDWLAPSTSLEQLAALMIPYPAELMDAYTVSSLVNHKREVTNIPEVCSPFIYTALDGPQPIKPITLRLFD